MGGLAGWLPVMAASLRGIYFTGSPGRRGGGVNPIDDLERFKSFYASVE